MKTVLFWERDCNSRIVDVRRKFYRNESQKTRGVLKDAQGCQFWFSIDWLVLPVQQIKPKRSSVDKKYKSDESSKLSIKSANPKRLLSSNFLFNIQLVAFSTKDSIQHFQVTLYSRSHIKHRTLRCRLSGGREAYDGKMMDYELNARKLKLHRTSNTFRQVGVIVSYLQALPDTSKINQYQVSKRFYTLKVIATLWQEAERRKQVI